MSLNVLLLFHVSDTWIKVDNKSVKAAFSIGDTFFWDFPDVNPLTQEQMCSRYVQPAAQVCFFCLSIHDP